MKARRATDEINCFVKYWEIIAKNLTRAGWSWGYSSYYDCCARQIFSVDAHRFCGERFVVQSDEILSAFLELEKQTKQSTASALPLCDFPFVTRLGNHQ